MTLSDIEADLLRLVEEVRKLRCELARFDFEELNLEAVKRRTVMLAIIRAGGSLREAANLLGMGRATIYKYVREANLPVHLVKIANRKPAIEKVHRFHDLEDAGTPIALAEL